MSQKYYDVSTASSGDIKSLSYDTKIRLAEIAIKTKNNDSLKNILAVMEYPQNILVEACEYYNSDAVKLIIKATEASTKSFNNEYFKQGKWIENNYFMYDDFDIINSHIDQKGIKSEITRYLFAEISKEFITSFHLNILSKAVTKTDFFEICSSKELDLTDAKFKDLKLSAYEYEDIEPILTINETNNKTLVNILLSHTYSDNLSPEYIANIYIKLYNLSPISKEMMAYTAALLTQGDNLKIIFEEGSNSYYSQDSNTIKINTSFAGNSIFNIESVLIHEVGHFIYDKLFESDAMPFDLTEIKIIAKDLYREFVNDPIHNNFFNDEILPIIFNGGLKNFWQMWTQYIKAARMPIDKAMELLKFDSSECQKYIDPNSYAQCFISASKINMFFFNGWGKLELIATKPGEDPIPGEVAIPDELYLSLLSIYSNETETCIATQNPYQSTKDIIIDWVNNEMIPQLIDGLALTPQQVHFLDRIGDYINRGDGIITSDLMHSEERLIELIVRASELRASIGSEKDLIESFSLLEDFHHQYASAKTCNYLSDHPETSSMIFYEGANSILEDVCLI